MFVVPKLLVVVSRNPVVQLYRTISKEVPRVLTIYDADIPVEDVSAVMPLMERWCRHGRATPVR